MHHTRRRGEDLIMWKRPKDTKPSDDREQCVALSPAASQQAHTSAQPLLENVLQDLDSSTDDYATKISDRILELAVSCGASDVHLDATGAGYLLRLRMDGQLREIGAVPRGQQASISARLKSLAQLLSYRSDIPQEGRLIFGPMRREARVVTFPTLHGERIVIRIAPPRHTAWQLSDLGLNTAQKSLVERSLQSRAGVVLFSGPVGSGKTTSAYASLRWIVSDKKACSTVEADRGHRCVVTLEDPIESEVPGTAQAQIDPSVGFEWSTGLRSLLRQDPEVIFIGEIRDAETAQLAFRASMAGQLVISTMHASSACEALTRLLDMQVPSQHLLSGLRLLTCQRLVRRRCPECEAGCERCQFSGFAGRMLLSECLPEPSGSLARAILSASEVRVLERAAQEQGFEPLAVQAAWAVEQRQTTVAEVTQSL